MLSTNAMENRENISQEPDDNHQRSWTKWGVEIGYNLGGWFYINNWRQIIRALRQIYTEDNLLPALIENSSITRVSLENCFVNLALIDEINFKRQETANLSGEAAAAFALERGDIYRALLATESCKGVETLFATLDNREKPTGWMCITGRAGTGKTTLQHYMAYRWGKQDMRWFNRFDFVFRLKLNFLGQKEFWEDRRQSALDYLVSLAHKSLGSPHTISPKDIRDCLVKKPLTTLLLLDGFDEIQFLYKTNSNVKNLIVEAMRFGNGILTSRPNAVLDAGIEEERFVQHFENLGLTEENVRKYVKNYFAVSSHVALGESLLAELKHNPEIMSFAQVPVTLSALCLTWDKEAKKDAEDKKPLTMTVLYTRVVVWIARRYYTKCRLTLEERAAGFEPDNPTKTTALHILKICDYELQALAFLAYDAFKENQLQSVSPTLLDKHFGRKPELLHKLNTEWGILRSFQIPEEEGKYPRHYFIHLTYQEYFIAFYIAKKFSDAPCNNHEEEMERRKHIQEIIELIRDKRKEKHCEIILVFLAGLLATPSYAKGADYFWNAYSEEPFSTLLPTIGWHSHIQTIAFHHKLYRNTLSTHIAGQTRRALSALLKQRELQQTLQSVTLALPDVNWHLHIPAITHYPRLYNEALTTHAVFSQDHELIQIFPTELKPILESIQGWWRLLENIKGLNFFQSEQKKEMLHQIDIQLLDWSEPPLLSVNSLFVSVFTRAKALTLLRSALSSENIEASVRRDAANFLREICHDDSESITALQLALKDQDKNVRKSAAKALEEADQHGLEEVYGVSNALRAVYENEAEDLDVRLVAERANMGDFQRSILENKEKDNFRIESKKYLEENPETVENFLSILNDRSNEKNVRKKVLQILSKLGINDQKTLDALRQALEDEDDAIRLAAAEALLMIKNENERTSSTVDLNIGIEDNILQSGSNAFLGYSIILIPILCSLSEKNYQDDYQKITLPLNDVIDIQNIEALQMLLNAFRGIESNKIKYPRQLKAVYQINIALLQIKAEVYAIFPHILTDEISQRFFVRVVWLSMENLLIDYKKFKIYLNKKEFTPLGTLEEWKIFFDNMILYQNEFISTLAAETASQKLIDYIHQLKSSIVFIPETFTTDTSLIYEDISCVSQINYDVHQELQQLKQTVIQHGDDIKENAEAVQRIENELTKLITKILERLDALPASLWETAKNQEFISEEERIYVENFKKILVKIYIAAQVASTGILQIAIAGNIGNIGKIISAISRAAPMGTGVIFNFFGYFLQTVDQAIILNRMQRLSELGTTPGEVAQLSDILSQHLFRCRSVINPVNQNYLKRFLSATNNIVNSVAQNGFYGGLLQVMIDAGVTSAMSEQQNFSAIQDRAEQDAQLFLAAIAEQGMPATQYQCVFVIQNTDPKPVKVDERIIILQEQKDYLTAYWNNETAMIEATMKKSDARVRALKLPIAPASSIQNNFIQEVISIYNCTATSKQKPRSDYLFLFAVPLMLIVDKIYWNILTMFCQSDAICQRKNYTPQDLNVKQYKREKFYGNLVHIWHLHVDCVQKSLENDGRREVFISSIATHLSTKRHYDGSVGALYFKEDRGLTKEKHVSLNNSALSPETLHDVMHEVTASFIGR